MGGERTCHFGVCKRKSEGQKEMEDHIGPDISGAVGGKRIRDQYARRKINIYTSAVDEQEYLENESKSFLEKLYGNSLTAFVSSLYQGNAISDGDLAELRKYIDQATKGE